LRAKTINENTVFLIIFFLVTTSSSLVPVISFATESPLAEADNTPSQTKPVDHVIVIMQGRRSFDHYFGTYPGVDGLSNDTRIPMNSLDDNSTQHVSPFHLEETSFIPRHSSKVYELSYNNGSMNGFAYAQNLEGYEGEKIMGYYDSRDLPYYWDLASKYVLADKFFSPTMRTGLPNYLTLYAGHHAEYIHNKIPEQGLEINTIFDSLEERNIPWKVYVQNYDPSINYTNKEARTDLKLRFNPLLAIPRFVHNETLNSHIVDLDTYFTDLRGNNSLPNVAFITAPESNERAPRSPAEGQEFVVSLVAALMKSKYWTDSAFVITYDEPGGWYDHVVPPLQQEFEQGFRVPTIIVSPYAKLGYVDSTTYDVTSILKFIEYLFGLAPMTVRDESANNLLNAFDFTKPPNPPYIPTGKYGNYPQIEGQKVSVEGIQIIYGTVMAAIPGIAILWIFLRKKRANAKVYDVKTG
jgi:phospholipase C